MVLLSVIFVLTCFSLGQSLDANSYTNYVTEHNKFTSNFTDKVATLKVSVYYEILCPASIQFIVHQLFPAYQLIGHYLNVELIPFGNAKTSNSTGKWEISCQNGLDECYGNKIQSCAIELNSIPHGVYFTSCAMESPDPSSDIFLQMCSIKVNVSWKNIKLCISNGQGDKLLALNGFRTKSVKPRVTSVPTVIFNDSFNKTLQNKAMWQFLKVSCSLLDNTPDACPKMEFNQL